MPCLSVSFSIELPTILSRLIFFIVHNHVIAITCVLHLVCIHTHTIVNIILIL